MRKPAEFIAPALCGSRGLVGANPYSSRVCAFSYAQIHKPDASDVDNISRIARKPVLRKRLRAKAHRIDAPRAHRDRRAAPVGRRREKPANPSADGHCGRRRFYPQASPQV